MNINDIIRPLIYPTTLLGVGYVIGRNIRAYTDTKDKLKEIDRPLEDKEIVEIISDEGNKTLSYFLFEFPGRHIACTSHNYKHKKN